MGIKGIYGEVGPGERVAFSKLAVEKFEQTGRPLRVAIDIAIWQFQIQSGRGGTNPAIRTFYFRLLRLLSLSIQPLFVFDGPHKPTFKRNKRVGTNGASLPNAASKQLLKLFGFPYHVAPGEAEAECALLQRQGIVDAVLSEDVDTLMFGCGLTFRNWSSEGPRGSKAPTHVSVYEAEATKKGKSGLDREGMILVALMSGGDYITAGIPGCGIKVACEAARAGFGKSLCRVSRSDLAAMNTWRENLAHEIQTNESKYFRVKHKALKIPENFPNKEVLGYYTHPVVSSESNIARLMVEVTWDEPVDIPGLRQWTVDTFDWKYTSGARKFIRGLAPALLVHKLRLRGDHRDSGFGDLILTADNEMQLVRSICGNRIHFSSDGIPELRVIYHPNDIVELDLDSEEDAQYDDKNEYGRDGLAPVLDDEDTIEPYVSDDADVGDRSESPRKRAPSQYDPTQPDKLWIPATWVRIGVPLKAEDYEESLRNPQKFLKQRAAEKRAAKKRGGMPTGAMDKFVKITKPTEVDTASSIAKVQKKSVPLTTQPQLPPVFLAPSLEEPRVCSQPTAASTIITVRRSGRTEESSTRSVAGTKGRTSTMLKSAAKSRVAETFKRSKNPWTQAQTSASSQPTALVTKYTCKSTTPLKVGSTRPSFPVQDLSVISLLSSPLNEASPEPALERYNSQSPIPSAISMRKRKSPSPSISIHSDGISEDEADGLHIAKSAPSRRNCSPRNITSRAASPDLPSVEAIAAPPPSLTTQEHKVLLSLSSSQGTSTAISRMKETVNGTAQRVGRKSKGKYYIARDSLPGAWKTVEGDMMEGRLEKGRAWRVSGVEMIDLSEDY
ncbi:Flap structure-specific endonuclease [Phlyctema vagabunda]|uniref:Flap structure-specific endonuclease n=1 Tax=Phlyctema vagabunda TaxID=108571 RepID=A0ABR4PY80_9HELO